MGKQINYYMEYDSFVLLAKKAIELGCEIMPSSDGVLKRGYSPDIISKDNHYYCFHIPEAGEIKIERHGDKEHVVCGYNASGSSIIEAYFSFINSKEKFITRSRIYCISDYYDADGTLIKRPDCVTKVYDSLARYVKKLAPCTEVECRPANPLYDKVKQKVYITPLCLALVCEQDYWLH
ncbi:MAG: hypothetical protein IIT57_01045 [Treponema sp.]|nr:hypothetical protein [Treponema sp.]